jgi:hypothetical protein
MSVADEQVRFILGRPHRKSLALSDRQGQAMSLTLLLSWYHSPRFLIRRVRRRANMYFGVIAMYQPDLAATQRSELRRSLSALRLGSETVFWLGRRLMPKL